MADGARIRPACRGLMARGGAGQYTADNVRQDLVGPDSQWSERAGHDLASQECHDTVRHEVERLDLD